MSWERGLGGEGGGGGGEGGLRGLRGGAGVRRGGLGGVGGGGGIGGAVRRWLTLGGEQAAHGARPPCGGGDAPSLGSSSREGVLRCSSEVTEATSASHSPPPPVRTGHPPSCEGAAPLTPPDRFTPRAFLFQSSIVLLSRLPDPQVAVSSVARLGIVAPARGRDNLTLRLPHVSSRWRGTYEGQLVVGTYSIAGEFFYLENVLAVCLRAKGEGCVARGVLLLRVVMFYRPLLSPATKKLWQADTTCTTTTMRAGGSEVAVPCAASSPGTPPPQPAHSNIHLPSLHTAVRAQRARLRCSQQRRAKAARRPAARRPAARARAASPAMARIARAAAAAKTAKTTSTSSATCVERATKAWGRCRSVRFVANSSTWRANASWTRLGGRTHPAKPLATSRA